MHSSISYTYVFYVLNEVFDRLKQVYLDTSVLGPVRLYSALDDVDQEFWTLFCALVDFQMPVVDILNPMLRGLVTWMEERNLKFIHLIWDEGLARKIFSSFRWVGGRGVNVGFTHRFVKIDDVVLLFRIFKKIIDEYASLKSIVMSTYEESLDREEPMENVLSTLVSIFRSYGGKPPLTPIKTSSTLKRLNLFMRWMVRPYPDLGLWNFIDKRHLLISLDEGLQRVLSRAFSFKVSLNWRGVLEATNFLRKIDPSDPAKYDYLLSRISIMGYCAKDISRSKCYLCPLIGICETSKFKPAPKTKALRGREQRIFEDFLKSYGHAFDDVKTEYPLGNYTADALLHKPNCETFIVEVEEELNYNAIGQVIVYQYLYFRTHGKIAKPAIICSKIRRDIKEACETEQGIKIIEVKNP